jgi:UDP-2,4-diacetamido-2,4,6-trideoxy-beta-L-altropyranose hydrolase
MRVAIRTDASRQIGAGHLMRCLTLAEGLRSNGAQVEFVTRQHERHWLTLIAERDFAIHALPAPAASELPADGLAHAAWLGAAVDEDAAQTMAALKQSNEDVEWLIVDHYGVDAHWERSLRSAARRIMVIDDLADRAHDCDILLDQNLVADMGTRYRGLVPQKCALLLGPDYALLQPAYAQLRDSVSPREGFVRRILTFFGGGDLANLTEKALFAFLNLERPDIRLDVVVGRSHPSAASIARLAASHPNVTLHSGLPSLAPLMAQADLAIGAGGATSWERLCLKVPTIMITTADNQLPTARELQRLGLADWLGHWDEVDAPMLQGALSSRLAGGREGAWRGRESIVDGLGEARVSAAIMIDADTPLALRWAGEADEGLLLEWANDADTRQNAFNPECIAPETHSRWFKAKRADPECRIFIFETADQRPVGQVRFEREDETWLVSYSIAPGLRGRGLGSKILEKALFSLGSEGRDDFIVGRVKPANVASRRIFEKLGFALVAQRATALEFRRSAKSL